MKIDPGNFADCLGRIAARGAISANEALDVLQQVADRAEDMRRTGIADPNVAAARQLADHVRTRAKRRAVDAVRNAKVRKDAIDFVSDGWAKGGGQQAASHIRSLLYWVAGNAHGRDVESAWKAAESEWGGLAFGKLHAAGLTDAARSPDMIEPIAQELLNYRAMAEAKEAGSPAEGIARVWAPIAENMRQRLNSVGARIANATDYIMHMSHDPELLRNGGAGLGAQTREFEAAFGRWWKFTEPLLNEERTFGDLLPAEGETMTAARERFAHSAFNAMVTGIRKGHAPGPETYVPPRFEGTSNLARKLSEGRVFAFKDAPSWTAYIKAYSGKRNMLELMNDAVNSASRRYGLMKQLGSNPEANFATIIRRVEEKFRDADPDGLAAFQRGLQWGIHGPNVNHALGMLNGEANIPSNRMAYRIMSTARQMMDMAFLGAVQLTHVTSAASTFTSEARFHGVPALRALADAVKALVPESLKGPERVEVLERLGAYGDAQARPYFDSFGTDAMHGGVPGAVSFAHQRFMTATGLPYFISHFKAGMRELISYDLAKRAGDAFSALDPHVRAGLSSYGIGPEEWDLMRAVPMTTGGGLRSYLTPYDVKLADAGAVENLLRGREMIGPEAAPEAIAGQVETFRQDLADRYAMYLTNAADRSTVTPGVRERALVGGGAQPGTFAREAAMSMTQYKTWALAAAHQMVAREYFEGLGYDPKSGFLSNLGRPDAMMGLGAILGFSVLGGYIRMAVRDMAYGDEPRLPRTWGDGVALGLQGLAQGGGLGIFGDMLFGQFNRFGVSNASSFGGPLATATDEIFQMYQNWTRDALEGGRHDYWPDLARWGLQFVPGANLVYLKAALDYMLLYHVYEAMSPGWWRRSNERMLRQQGRTRMGYRAGAGVPWGIPGLYLQNGGEASGVLAGH